ncbi:Elongation factor Ts [bacterium HR40]|nr:Elongation factor Ts [bacterium HR40]
MENRGMTQITASLVKELRERTGAGMMDCKKALAETAGDLEAAIDWLRKKGLAAAAKKAGRATSEGLVGMVVADGRGALVEVNSETDFVARNETFQELVRRISALALEAAGDIEKLRKLRVAGSGRTVEEEITQAIAVIGENIQLRRTAFLAVEPGVVAGYVHAQVAPQLGRLGVLVALRSKADPAKLAELGRQLAMHIAATNPQAVSVDRLDAALVERERSILAEQARASGKPEAIVQKMVEGRLRKFYEEVVLLEQAFVLDPDRRVREVLAAFEKETGEPVEVAGMVRMVLGEGIEKPSTDFAAEVAQLGGGR